MLSDDQIKELEAKHKRVARCGAVGGEWEVVFRAPNRAEYKRFRAAINNPNTAPDAQEQLARQCVVYPSREAFDALLEEWPAIPEACSKAFSRLMGLAVDDDVK